MADVAPVRLRPLAEADLALLYRVDTDPSISAPFEWVGFHDPGERRRRFEEDGFLGGDQSMLALAGPEGAFLGWVCWWAVAGMAPPRSVFELGIMLLPEHRGRGIGTEAQRLLADYLFQTTLANRLQAATDVDNQAERRALEKAGFPLEGQRRGISFLGGHWRDDLLYSRLRQDPTPAP